MEEKKICIKRGNFFLKIIKKKSPSDKNCQEAKIFSLSSTSQLPRMFLCLFYSLSLYLLYSPPFSHLLLTSIFLSSSSTVRFYLAIGGKLVILARRKRERETQRHHTFLHHQGKASDGRLAHCTGSGAKVGSEDCSLSYSASIGLKLSSVQCGGILFSIYVSFSGFGCQI